ncbi:5'-3' exonuclease [Microtetraspora malaysiensis]|uniref:5'-3' exonuclease n=1 Tax=Microtetraspora malaysiensis TaxID=161358 RepID=A0ABW6SKL2_9ACTN
MTATPLLLVDGHHLLYRSWWGFSDKRIMSRDKRRDLTGVFGFLAILRKTHLEEAPDHEIVVAFDGENAAASRTVQDPGYKANRADADHSPIRSLGMVKAGLDTAGVPWIELDGHEGDDVIATLAHHAAAQGRTVTCYSGDRDLYQLLTDQLTVLTPARRRVTSNEVHTRYGVTADQWPDYRALTGDASDNIPGVPGVGPKSAAALLAGGIHLEQLAASPRLATGRGRAVADHWDAVLTWREMIRLQRGVPVPDNTCVGMATPAMPRAAAILEHLDLW